MYSTGARKGTRKGGILALCAGGLLATGLMLCSLLGIARAQSNTAHSFLLTLRPTEGALLEFLGSKEQESAGSWHIDLDKSNGLDHVDVVNVGMQPSRTASGGADAVARLKTMFQAPQVWAWGIRARSEGSADVLLRRNASASDGSPVEMKVIHVNVVNGGRDALFQLPLQPGERASIEIWTNPSTGAQWRVDAAASSGLAPIKIEPGRTYDPSDPTDWLLRGRLGASMLQEWRIVATDAGTAHIALDYGPGWEKQTFYRRLLIDVITPPLN
jgi:predicted secreted protein